MWVLFTQEQRQIKKQLKKGLSTSGEAFLKECLPFINEFSTAKQAVFKKRVHEFIVTKPIYGYQTEIDEKIKLMVAASAVLITLSFDHWQFNYLNSVVIVSGPLNADFHEKGAVLGQVTFSGLKNQMVLSKESLVQGFKNLNDKKNVSIHEFAHVLDHADGKVDGIPSALMPAELIDEWQEIVQSEIIAIERGHSEVNPYGATNEAEFFAVISEYFFENPERLKQKHPRLYQILSQTFQQENSALFARTRKKWGGVKPQAVGRNSPCPCGSGKKFKKCCLR